MSYVVVYRAARGAAPGSALHHRKGREDRTGGRQTAGEGILGAVAHGHDPAGERPPNAAR